MHDTYDTCNTRGRFRALQQFEAFHEGESIRLHQFEIMQVANLMQADSEVEEVRCGSMPCARLSYVFHLVHDFAVVFCLSSP